MSFLLHHELLPGAGAKAWLLILHGIYGSGRNWRSFARELVRRRPAWGAVLVDLREHGASVGAPPPHDLESAARDLAILTEELAGGGRPVRAICGHSFGGKVALRRRLEADASLLQTWVLDASPAARPGEMEGEGSVVSVLRMLEELPARWRSRDDFVAEIAGRGYPEALGRWLAMNLEPAESGYENRLVPASMRALLGDYYRNDLWRAAEDPALPGELHVVAAGRSSALAPEDLGRFRRLAARQTRIRLHEIPEAGHWLHIDAPEALVEIVAGGLAPPGGPA